MNHAYPVVALSERCGAAGWGEFANPSISRLQTPGFVTHPGLRQWESAHIGYLLQMSANRIGYAALCLMGYFIFRT